MRWRRDPLGATEPGPGRLAIIDGYRMVRYADDFVVLCRTADEALDTFRLIEAWVKTNGLTLHPDKTRIGDCRERGQGFEFLGYRFEAGRRYVRKKSRDAFRDKVRAKTGRNRGVSLGRIIAGLNPMLRGWFGYFKHAAPTDLSGLDGFIRRRLRAALRKQEKRPGFGMNPNDHRRWPIAFFAIFGEVSSPVESDFLFSACRLPLRPSGERVGVRWVVPPESRFLPSR